jgi:hypothetical protein
MSGFAVALTDQEIKTRGTGWDVFQPEGCGRWKQWTSYAKSEAQGKPQYYGCTLM